MKNRNKVWGLGLLASGMIIACAPTVHELGDEPAAGAGGSESGGSGSVVPRGGSQTTPGPDDGGEPSNVAGAPSEPECFSPTHYPERLILDDALGCRCDTPEEHCLSDLTSEPPWNGMLACAEGRWKSVPPTCEETCFSPVKPRLAFEPDGVGCPCDDDPPVCVADPGEGGTAEIGLFCEDGKWTTTPLAAHAKSPCSLRRTDCRVADVIYPHGARGVPDPFSCNSCQCDNGLLTRCTELGCPTTCDEGTYAAWRCVQCGPVDECVLMETGCLSGPRCETGVCEADNCV